MVTVFRNKSTIMYVITIQLNYSMSNTGKQLKTLNNMLPLIKNVG